MGWTSDALTPLKAAPRVREFIALDTEDDQLGYGDGRGFYLGTVHTPKGTHVFTRRSAMIRFLDHPRWAGWWCATYNLEYDALNLWSARGVTEMLPCFSGSRLCALKLKVSDDKHGYLTLFDVGSFLAGGLAPLARLVNLSKLEARHRAGDRRVDRDRIRYCARDAEITWKLAGFVQDGVNALGAEMKLTAAATALDLFRRRYLHARLPCLEGPVQGWLHRGYCGGRVECFRLGDYRGPVFQNDVNGAYVSVMVNQALPDLDNLMARSGTGLDLAQEGMAECWLDVPRDLWAGPLPRKADKLTFPVGRLLGRWTFNELRLAEAAGCRIQRVGTYYQSRHNYPYLREMMTALRAIRESPTTPPAVNRMAKLMGNSLYGKFAQRHEEFCYLPLREYQQAVRLGQAVPGVNFDPNRTKIYDACQVVRVVTGTKIPKHSNVIWSAIITAGCRALLYPHLDKATTYYCDTDSVIGLRAYPASRKLGELALQHSYTRLIIRGNKVYAGRDAGGWNAHAKGVPEGQALAAVRHAGIRLRHKRPVKLRTALTGRAIANRWIEVHKELRAEYDKRRVLPGGETLPLTVREW